MKLVMTFEHSVDQYSKLAYCTNYTTNSHLASVSEKTTITLQDKIQDCSETYEARIALHISLKLLSVHVLFKMKIFCTKIFWFQIRFKVKRTS